MQSTYGHFAPLRRIMVVPLFRPPVRRRWGERTHAGGAAQRLTLGARARGEEAARRGYNASVVQILKVSPGASSEEDELAFELAYQRNLSTAQRFEMMLARSRQIAEELIRRGHRKPVEIVKRS
jgi:hypothetical protein